MKRTGWNWASGSPAAICDSRSYSRRRGVCSRCSRGDIAQSATATSGEAVHAREIHFFNSNRSSRSVRAYLDDPCVARRTVSRSREQNFAGEPRRMTNVYYVNCDLKFRRPLRSKRLFYRAYPRLRRNASLSSLSLSRRFLSVSFESCSGRPPPAFPPFPARVVPSV